MRFTCVDSFSGAGGLSLGLGNAGFDVLLSFDVDKNCIETIKSNKKYFKHLVMREDIMNMIDGRLMDIIGLKQGELFLLAGGPPCQGFSIQRIGEDADSRNELIFLYGRLVNEIRPMFFVMENVSGIEGKRGKAILGELMGKMTSIGYCVHKELLDAKDYGVPQRRKRIVLVGEREDIGTNYSFPKPTGEKKTVRETIGFLPEPPGDGTPHVDYPLHRRDKLSEINLRRI
ncbi:MAG: DNA (cytosine-5-)-methyltransferase [Oscillospiraceae bacterium]|nr:DNA (cytosine-5-)-methyltransferase [Oscillospiraceae bacterium]